MFDQKIIAHRGIFDNVLVVENTLPSFQAAIDLKIPFELDVQLTKDNRLVVFHDDTLKRLASSYEVIQEMTYEEIQKVSLLKTKEKIPLLSDVLKLNHDQVYIDIEIKKTKRKEETITYLLQELEPYHRFVVKSFDPSLIRLLKKKKPSICCGVLIHDHYDKFYFTWFAHSSFLLSYSKCDFVALSKKMLSSSKLMKKYRNYPILVWTIQKKEELPGDLPYTYICNHLPYSK